MKCYDKYGNPTGRGGDIFSVVLTGMNLETINRATVDGKVYDKLNDGTYDVEFLILWPGKYTVSILLNSLPYG